MTFDDPSAAKTAAAAVYDRAVAGGANIHVAFDLACRAYRAAHPSMHESGLRQAVASEIGLSREDSIVIAVGASA
jgi:hypothetical protein